MSALDLTAAVTEGALAITDSMCGRTWLSRGPRDVAGVAVTAAAPLIEAAVREQIAAEIEASAHMVIGERYVALMDAARIARTAR